MVRTVRELLGECLRSIGVTRVWGEPLGQLTGIDPCPIDDADVAVLLADADGRIGNGFGVAAIRGGVLHLSSKPGGTAAPRTVATADGLVDAFAALGHISLPTTVALHLDLDLDEPLEDEELEPRADPPEGVVMTLNASFAEAEVVVVVGPGVTRGGYVQGLLDLTRKTGWGVVNTWGAKGVLEWYDMRHFGTAGLQGRDFELAGLNQADLVIASGLDPDESPLDTLGSALVQEVEPWQLAALTYLWETPAREITERPLLYGNLSAAVTPMYEATTVPLAPARGALHLSGGRPDGGLVVGDAGLSGFWLARTFPTRETGSIVVPATRQPGFAVAAALVAGVAGRPCVAVVDGPIDDASAAMIEEAARLEVPIAVQVWGDDGELADVDAHARLTEAQFAGQHGVVEVPIRPGDEAALIHVAGPLVAWGGA
jgi:hypothetical protein